MSSAGWFGLIPRFAQAHDALSFARAPLARPSRSANPRLFALLHGQVGRELAELAENQLFNRMRYWLGMSLGAPLRWSCWGPTRRCGFAELAPFYRAFRRWQGATPRAWRQA